MDKKSENRGAVSLEMHGNARAPDSSPTSPPLAIPAAETDDLKT